MRRCEALPGGGPGRASKSQPSSLGETITAGSLQLRRQGRRLQRVLILTSRAPERLGDAAAILLFLRRSFRRVESDRVRIAEVVLLPFRVRTYLAGISRAS